jgi:hypothetical protein
MPNQLSKQDARTEGRIDLHQVSPALLERVLAVNYRLRQFLPPRQILAGIRESADSGEIILLQPRPSGYAWSDRTVPLALIVPFYADICVRLTGARSYRGNQPTPAVWMELRGFPKGDVAGKIAKWRQADDAVFIQRTEAMEIANISIECSWQSWNFEL